MTDPLLVTDDTVEQTVSYAEAIAAIDAVLRDGVTGVGDPVRTVVEVHTGQVLLMPSEGPSYVGVKVSTVAPANPGRGLPRISGVYVLADADTLAPVAVLGARALTVIRTSATSALSSRYLSAPDAAHLLVFGTGPQAWGHVLAHRAVRPIRRVGVVGRDDTRAEAFAERVRSVGVEGYVATPAAVGDADIVCACTTARTPLFDGGVLADHAHVVAVGSHEPDAREVDTATVRSAQVVVEDRRAAWREAGDLVIARDEGAVDESVVVADLRELAAGAPVDPRGRTLFKSVGAAFEDLAVAALAFARLAG